MGVMNNKSSYGYSKMEMEDPEEMSHRKAQFLIYKALERADSSTGRSARPSWIKVRVSKLKIKIGRRMKTLKKCLCLNMSTTKVGVHKKVVTQLTSWGRFFGVREAVVTLPPLFK